jgi:hypothetical protein
MIVTWFLQTGGGIFRPPDFLSILALRRAEPGAEVASLQKDGTTMQRSINVLTQEEVRGSGSSE